MTLRASRRDFLKLLALLAAGGGVLGSFGKTRGWLQSQGAPNILILVFDALSARHMSVYGYDRDTTPNMTRFAERSTVYHAHHAGGNHTTPGVASLLTGTYPWSHRAFHLHGEVAKGYARRNLFGPFAERGYHTFGYSHNLLVMSLLYQFRRDLELFKHTRDLCLVDAQYSDRLFPNDFNVSFWSEWLLLREGEFPPGSLFLSLLHRMLRFVFKGQLAKEYGSLFPRGLPELHSLIFVLEHAIDWLEDELTRAPRPFLGYIHLLPPHEPYTTRRDFVDLFEDGWVPLAKPPHFFTEGHSDEFLNRQRREYDEYIAYADAEFGRLYDFMAQAGVLDDTYVVVTSDHGELFERGIRGHVTEVLYEPVIHVPLVIARPGQRQREDVYAPTSCVDLMPTLLQVIGQSIPDWCEGRVLPAFGGGEGGDKRSIYSVEAKGNPMQAPLTKGTVALVRGQYKLIYYFGYDGYEREYELYDLANDPEEMSDLYSSESIATEMRSELEEKLREVNRPWMG